MKDLTTGSIPKHLVRLAAPMALGMLFQTAYIFVDLYFVSRLGDTAIAGVGAASQVQFIVMALTQVLGVGSGALIAQAIGRKDLEDASLVFNQSTGLAILCAAITLLLGYALTPLYISRVAADEATRAAGTAYMFAYLPGLALQFGLISMGSALRGSGIAKPTMFVQMLTVVLNAIFAPILIAGRPFGPALGVTGAGLATSFAVAIGVAIMTFFFRRESRIHFDMKQLSVRWNVWGRILKIGLPSGGEFALMFIFIGVVFVLIRPFGAHAQAGYAVASRVMQAIFLPAMAVAFATAPLAGQNFGGRHPERVRETFRSAAIVGSIAMLVPMAICSWKPELLVGIFATEPRSIEVGSDFLRMVAWNFISSGLIFTCSGMFQALGNTIPSLVSSATRLVTFVVPAFWMSRQPGFTLHRLWMLSVATVTAQAILSLLLLRRELHRKLHNLRAMESVAHSPTSPAMIEG